MTPRTWLRHRPCTAASDRRHQVGSQPGVLGRVAATTAFSGVALAALPLALDYVVRPGDTLSEIAAQHGTTVSRLVRANDLHPSGNQVYAGQVLSIPAAHGRRAEAAPPPADPDDRRIRMYTVRPGDTPSELAVRFHAWTAELVEMNGPVLLVGERIRIPVVVAAAREARRAAAARRADAAADPDEGRTRSGSAAPTLEATLPTPTRAQVRRIIEDTARRTGVDPDLALAVSWQEAGWQMDHVSSADAIGAMQVIPATGEWMSGVVGRPLDLTDTRDNVTAGVVLLKLLTDAAPLRKAVAGYYQGLAGVREHGMYPDTRRYVANVLALKRRFDQGLYPA